MRLFLPIIGILVLLKGRFLVKLARFFIMVRTGRGIARRAVAFQQLRQGGSPRILIAGDSTALGTGAESLEETIAGYFSKDFPNAHIRNVGVNGLRAFELKACLERVREEHFDLAVILIGGNDVVRGSDPGDVAHHLSEALDFAKKIGKHLLLMSQGNIGNAPIFPWPLYLVYTRRARKLREVLTEVAQERGVIFLDLFVERDEDEWLRAPSRYYSPDWFHPNGVGYREWYQYIQEKLREKGILL